MRLWEDGYFLSIATFWYSKLSLLSESNMSFGWIQAQRAELEISSECPDVKNYK